MSASLEYLLNRASPTEIAVHLELCDADFAPPLSSRWVIKDYAQKLASDAVRFETWSSGAMVGLVAAYCNNRDHLNAFITSVSVLREWTGQGIATRLIRQCVDYATVAGFQQISLKVASQNIAAIRLYEKSGFVFGRTKTPFLSMELHLKFGAKHERQA